MTSKSTKHRDRYSFREGLAMMAARDCGIDPFLAAEAGDDVRLALNLLRRAKASGDLNERRALAEAAKHELNSLDRTQHS